MDNELQKFEEWRKGQVRSFMETGYPKFARAFQELESPHWVAWQAAWQASRADIELEMPEFVGHQNVVVQELQAAFKASVEAAGLKVKP
jgi:hypothetical protein